MTSLDPSHNPFRDPSGRHAQAVHRSSPSAFPDDLDIDSDSDLGVDDHVRAELQGRRKGRRRVRAAMPPMPDLRFEQVSMILTRVYRLARARLRLMFHSTVVSPFYQALFDSAANPKGSTGERPGTKFEPDGRIKIPRRGRRGRRGLPLGQASRRELADGVLGHSPGSGMQAHLSKLGSLAYGSDRFRSFLRSSRERSGDGEPCSSSQPPRPSDRRCTPLPTSREAV
jgi:hypothetical protein